MSTTIPSPSEQAHSQAASSDNDTQACGMGGCGEKAVPLHVQELMAAVKDNITELPYDVPPENDPKNPWLARQIAHSWYNALQIAFEQLPTEPKKILHIGGCRQRDMARRIGFILPFAKITVLDSNQAIVDTAEEDIHCRFIFTQSNLPWLDAVDTHSQDLVLIPDIADDTSNPNALIAECERVLKPGGHIIIGQRIGWLNYLLRLVSDKALSIIEMPAKATYPSKKLHTDGLAKGLPLQPIPFKLHTYQV